MTKYYAGIGSRSTPIQVMELFESLATELETEGYILRSGGANGADTAFERGCENKEIYLPSNCFNSRVAYGDKYIDSTKLPNWGEAIIIAKEFHPAPQHLKPYSLQLMARNSYQVLGRDLKTPAKVLLCWTEGGKEIGGTSQAMRIAKAYGIPILNYGFLY